MPVALLFFKFTFTVCGLEHYYLFYIYIYIIQMTCSHSADREYPSGQRAGLRLGKHGFDSGTCTGRGAVILFFFPIFSSDWRPFSAAIGAAACRDRSYRRAQFCAATDFNLQNSCFGRFYYYYIGNGICCFRFLKNLTMMSLGASMVFFIMNIKRDGG